MPGGNARGPNGSAAHERIQHASAFWRDGQQIGDKLHGLGREMVFACRVHGVAVEPGQATLGMRGKVSFAPENERAERKLTP